MPAESKSIGHTAQGVSSESSNIGLWLIASFKLAKGMLLVAIGTGALTLLHKDVSEVVAEWVDALQVDPDNRYIHALLEKLMSIDDRILKEISAGTFLYAALLLTEGVGLFLRKRWAEYLTSIATASFIPLEVYGLSKHFSITKVAVIGINVAVVWYLIARLHRHYQLGPFVDGGSDEHL